MAKFKRGATVKQVLPAPIEGVVHKFVMNPDTGEVQYIVLRKDAEGVEHFHVFNEHEIEEVPKA